MIIEFDKWYEALYRRHSIRKYNGISINEEILTKLHKFSNELNHFLDGGRVVIVTEEPDKVFKGIIGSYGKIKNAPAYVAFIGDMSNPNVQEKVGYMGQCFILKATSLGLSTCWVGGFFKPTIVEKQITLLKNERVLAVSPIGYTDENYNSEERLMSGRLTSHKRKELEKLCLGNVEELETEWKKFALEAARLAPSAINRQPWRFKLEEGSITISIDSVKFELGVSKRLDCGIAMLHLEIGALVNGVQGKWEYLDSPCVAKFIY